MCACGGRGPNDGGFTINQICEIIIACRPHPPLHISAESGRAASSGSLSSPNVAHDALTDMMSKRPSVKKSRPGASGDGFRLALRRSSRALRLSDDRTASTPAWAVALCPAGI